MASAKICGITTPDALDAAVDGGASHVGFVFFAPSPRDVPVEHAAALAARAAGRAVPVGVYVDPDDETVARTVAGAGLRAIQLHGVTPARASHLRERFRVEAWAALPVRTRADLAGAAPYRGAVDRLLYDAKTPDGAPLPGGMGLRFDWALLDGFAHPLPWALSGGLDAGNVAEAIGRTGARLVDASSGVESARGVKDPGRIAAFLAAVARA